MKNVIGHEFSIGQNLNYIKEGNLIHIIVKGLQDDQIANSYLILHHHFAAKWNGKINYLVDLNQAGKSSPEARRVWKQLTEMATTNKVALVGLHPVARVLADFVMKITHNSELRFFSTEEEAMKWIKE